MFVSTKLIYINRGSFPCEAEYWHSKKCWDDFGPPFFCLSKNAEMEFQNGLSEVCYLGRDDWSIELANFEYLYHNLCIKVPWNMLLTWWSWSAWMPGLSKINVTIFNLSARSKKKRLFSILQATLRGLSKCRKNWWRES